MHKTEFVIEVVLREQDPCRDKGRKELEGKNSPSSIFTIAQPISIQSKRTGHKSTHKEPTTRASCTSNLI